MFAFAGCNDDEKEDENASVTYYLVGEETVDYTDIRILEIGSDYMTVDVKDVKIISGRNPVQFLSHKDCKSLTIVYKHRYEDGEYSACRRYILNEEEFKIEKDAIMLTLGETISDEEYSWYFEG